MVQDYPRNVVPTCRAQIAANLSGESRLHALITKRKSPKLRHLNRALLDYSDTLTMRWLATIPRGVFNAVDVLESDGLSEDEIPIRVQIEKKNDVLVIDFSNSAPSSLSSLNAVYAITRSAVFMCSNS